MEENKNEELEIVPEKKDEVIQEPINEEVNNNQNEEKKPEEKPKKSVINIIVWILFGFMILCAILYVLVLKPAYEKEKQEKENNREINEKVTPVPKNDDSEGENNEIEESSNIEILPTDSEEIKVTKQKLNEANSLFDGFTCENSTDLYDDFLCYYGTLDEFKNKFYGIYSKDLDYSNVYLDYTDYPKDDDSSEEAYMKREDYGHETSYKINDDKIYISHECRGSGSDGVELIDFKIVNSNENKIEANYNDKTLWTKADGVGFDEKITPHSIILVKEDGNWKISKATIFDTCDFTKEVGK